MSENNNLNNNPYDDWGLPKIENDEINNDLKSNNDINLNKNTINNNNNSNNINNSTNITKNNNINNTITSTNTINNNTNISNNDMINEGSKNNIFTETFYALNMNFIVPGLVLFGCIYLIFGAFNESKIIYYLVLLFCFGYSILIFILFLLHKIKNINNDIKQNGISILGKTNAEKAKSIFILCIIIFNLIIFLYGKLFVK